MSAPHSPTSPLSSSINNGGVAAPTTTNGNGTGSNSSENEIARFLQRNGVQPLSSTGASDVSTAVKQQLENSSSSSPNSSAKVASSPVLNNNNNTAASNLNGSSSSSTAATASLLASSASAAPTTATTSVGGGPTTTATTTSAVSTTPTTTKPLYSTVAPGIMHKSDDFCIPWADVHDSAVITVEGNPSDIWSIDDYGDPSDPSVFQFPAYLLGGGVARNSHMTFLQNIGFDLNQVPFSPARPYLKEPPPTNLPLESFDLRVIYDAGKTGFEDNKDFPITPGTIIAGRYKITEYIGSAAFSRAVQAIDLKHNAYVCVKIVRNSKDFFDQSLDEIKLLHYINCNGDPDQNHVVQLYDFFYYKEHVFLVCELLRDNLYEFGKYNREHEAEPYFTLARLQKITRQILEALVYVHSLNLLHCDLKPENVLIKSYSRCEVKVIDFGSSCFTTDNLSSYIQSRCYRAPEVVLGCKYDGRIDVWSLGAMLPELATGNVLLHNDTLPQMLGRISALLGPFPARMVREGRHSCRYITKSGLFYEVLATDEAKKALKKDKKILKKLQTGEVDDHADDDENNNSGNEKEDEDHDDGEEEEKLVFYYPKPRRLEELCGYDDPEFIDFIRQALTIDHKLRPTAAQLLQHPFMLKKYEGSEQIVQVSSSSNSNSIQQGGVVGGNSSAIKQQPTSSTTASSAPSAPATANTPSTTVAETA